MLIHEQYMRRCFDLARRGIGRISPNPPVGSVIVYDNRIIGEGYHMKYGSHHAEVNAINSIKESDRHLLPESTIYVSLEPCSHYGNTPPCVNLILEKQIPKVVIACGDPNPDVNGKSVRLLRSKGYEVVEHVLEAEGTFLARAFFTQMKKKRPYIILKYARSANGFMAVPGKQVWFSNAISARLMHKWRSQADAILVGTNTALTDNPSLTTRHWPGNSPLRIVLDPKARLPENLNLFNGETPTIVVTEKDSHHGRNAEVIQMPFNAQFIPSLTEALHTRKIQTLIVEGGAFTLNQFLRDDYWDEAHVVTGQKTVQDGIQAPIPRGHLLDQFQLDTDRIEIWVNPKSVLRL